MSGPKTSRYTLTPEQRRILAEQRKIERRKSVASESIKQSQRKLLQIGAMFPKEKAMALELQSRCGNDGGFSEVMCELETIIAPVGPAIAATDNDNVDSLESTAKSVSESVSKAEKLVHKLSQIAAQNELELRKKLSDAIDQGFATSFADIQPTGVSALQELKESIISKLLQMQKNVQLPVAMANEVSAALDQVDDITDEAFLKNYSALTITPLLRKCRAYLAEYESCHEEFERLYAEYVALCELYYYVAQDYTCSAAAIEALKAEIERINAAAAEDDEQGYICECLDAVMEEMGYNVIGHREVTKKSGKHFRSELYTYGEGSAVNITYSSDGRIMMELGGIDDADRTPDAQETAALCDSMESFCEDFKEIEKRLLAKGVVLKDRISLLPPGAEYAQIINTSKYDMTEAVGKLQAKKQRRKVATPKAMKKE